MAEERTFSLLDPFRSIDLDIDGRTDGIKQWAIANRTALQPIKSFFDGLIGWIENLMQSIPPTVMLLLIVLVAWQAAGDGWPSSWPRRWWRWGFCRPTPGRSP